MMFLSDQDDAVKPVSIEHGLDAMATETGDAFEFHYNYLIYRFEIDGLSIFAKYYFGQSEVALIAPISPDFSDHRLRAAMLYLALRYNKITYLSETGYVSLPEPLNTELCEQVFAVLGLISPKRS